MSAKPNFKYGFKAKAEKLSITLREELKLSKFAPLDAFALARHLSVPIKNVDEFQTDISDEHFLVLRDPANFSAMWMPTSDGQKIILHNNYHSAKRQQSNLMHELAHIILKHEVSEEAAQLCFMYGLHYYNTEQENEAKYFGGALQITRPGLQWSLKQNYSSDQISDYYNASVDMVKYRLNATGVLIQRGYQS